ncbi:MAG: HD-GYP domain-containing protein [Gammaproteobacteria bacterium]|nr:HD-GYP domain-containing protein [Gammaproteobacteria bacterium]
MDKRISTADLKVGMWVTNLDRPWLDTPFSTQAFFVASRSDIADLQKYCRYVYIDPAKGRAADVYMTALDEPEPSRPVEAEDDLPAFEIVYEDVTSVQEELPVAETAQQAAKTQLHEIMEEVRAGEKINASVVTQVVAPMLESVLRNPDAFLWLNRLKDVDDYTYSHSVDNCTVAIAFGRHLGLPKKELENLAMGMLMLDVGKMRLPSELLNKPGRLTEAEFQAVQQHVEYGLEALEESGGFGRDAFDITRTHHERHNGTGYPNQLSGNLIPVYGRVAGLIDCYSALTSARSYSRAMSQNKALQKIYDWRNIYFQAELVEEFIQCMGMYPTGSIVEMSSGEIGIVLSQNRARRMRPKVMLVLNPKHEPYESFMILDLMAQFESQETRALDIVKSLEPGSFGIDPADYFL